MKIEGVLAGVTVKSVNTRRGPGQVFEVYVDGFDRPYETWDGGMGAKAGRLQGQRVVVEYEERVNGRFTNLNIVDVEPSFGNGELQQIQPQMPTQPERSDWQPATPSWQPATTPNVTGSLSLPTAAPLSKDDQINRAVALKAAVHLWGSLTEEQRGKGSLGALVANFQQFLKTGKWPVPETPSPFREPGVGETGTAVSAGAVADGDDIPF